MNPASFRMNLLPPPPNFNNLLYIMDIHEVEVYTFHFHYYAFICVIRGTFRKIRGTFREISSPLQKSGGTLDAKRGTLRRKSDFSKGGSKIRNLHLIILLFYRYLQKNSGGGGDINHFLVFQLLRFRPTISGRYLFARRLNARQQAHAKQVPITATTG